MPDSESHPVRNAVFATVIGGVILSAIPPSRELIVGILTWLWSGVVWAWKSLGTDYSLPGWILLIAGILSFVAIARIYAVFRPEHDAEYKSYTEDMLYGAVWRWSWAGNNISDLWCFCPRCDAQLVYNDSSCRRLGLNTCKTDFICERCGNSIVASIEGGNMNYAIGAAKREIRRRIRTNEYINSDNQTQ